MYGINLSLVIEYVVFKNIPCDRDRYCLICFVCLHCAENISLQFCKPNHIFHFYFKFYKLLTEKKPSIYMFLPILRINYVIKRDLIYEEKREIIYGKNMNCTKIYLRSHDVRTFYHFHLKDRLSAYIFHFLFEF